MPEQQNKEYKCVLLKNKIMNKQQLLQRIQDIEWDNFEVKTARRDVICSDKFDFEKGLFVYWYKEGRLSLSALQNIYSDFAAYRNDLKLDSWANTYIQSYKQAKIEDRCEVHV